MEGELPDYRDPSLPIDRRVDDLIERMTLTELVAQLTAVPACRLVETTNNHPPNSSSLTTAHSTARPRSTCSNTASAT